MNRSDWIPKPRGGVNIGIAKVVPADKIIELLNYPTFAIRRENVDRALGGMVQGTADNV